jgi:hypothetical protein
VQKRPGCNIFAINSIAICIGNSLTSLRAINSMITIFWNESVRFSLLRPHVEVEHLGTSGKSILNPGLIIQNN